MQKSRLFLVAQRRFRGKRFVHIERLIRELLENNDTIKILDAGGRARYWKLLPVDLRSRVSVTVLNFEKDLAQFDNSVEGLLVECATGNACDMPEFEDKSFDLVHSNSVVEHVGSYANMISFANEVRRVGEAYFVQTPSFWFPIDPHYGRPFIHWLPGPLRIWLFQRTSLGYMPKIDFERAMVRGDYIKIISKGIMVGLFPDADIKKERFALMTKSIMAIRRS